MEDIHTIPCTSAAQFVAALRRSDPFWLPDGHENVPWIFRGQRESSWELIPSAWRASAKSHELYRNVNESDLEDAVKRCLDRELPHKEWQTFAREFVVQIRFEFLAARVFAELADDLGLPIPGGRLPRTVSYDPMRWIVESEPFHPTVALAQHHGMPTRLLDWTHNPLIAAFFAADGANGNDPGDIVVWAVYRPALLLTDIREFTVQRSQIGFLHAQEGLFTYMPEAENIFLVTGQWPRMEAFLPPDALRRITLPKSESPQLRRLLRAERISKAHLMPTLDNVTRALHDLLLDRNVGNPR